MMKTIVAIDREFGAGGSTIAAKLAGRLGWTLLDQKLTQGVARPAKIPAELCLRREGATTLGHSARRTRPTKPSPHDQEKF